jgi:hypothetical protein
MRDCESKICKGYGDAKQANLTNLEAAVKYTIERARAEVSASNAKVTQAQLDLAIATFIRPSAASLVFSRWTKETLSDVATRRCSQPSRYPIRYSSISTSVKLII